jgi:hypothetical protein
MLTSKPLPDHSRKRRHRPLIVAAVAAVLLCSLGPGVADASLTVRVVNTGGVGIASRSAPQIGAQNGYGAPEGAVVTTVCWTWGDSVGPYNNRLWWLISYAGRQFYAADRYLSTPNVANQPPAGEPQCGVAPPPPPPPAPQPPPPPPASGDAPAVWVGSPFSGTWVPENYDCPPNVSVPVAQQRQECSEPAYHHFLAASAAPVGDWSVDLGDPAGTPVTVYAAPQNPSVAITTKVSMIRAACRSTNPADGGMAVTVAFYAGGTPVGSASYGHVVPAAGLYEGKEINRWGTVIGTIGTGYNKPAGCWTGPHLHMQLYSTHHYACYNKDWHDKQHMNPTSFVGFIGGNYASGSRQRCP